VVIEVGKFRLMERGTFPHDAKTSRHAIDRYVQTDGHEILRGLRPVVLSGRFTACTLRLQV
jgi:hypothetical protein